MSPRNAIRAGFAVASWLGLLSFLSTAAAPAERPPEEKQEKVQKPKKLSRKELEALAAALPAKHRTFLEDVAFLISDPERLAFLQLDKDYQRDAFIEQFWQARDPYPGTARNELKEKWEARLDEVRTQFGTTLDERAQIVLLNGQPADLIEIRCSTVLWPIQVWFYDGSDQIGEQFFVILYQDAGLRHWRVWEPADGLHRMFQNGSFADADGTLVSRMRQQCLSPDMDALYAALANITQLGPIGYPLLLERLRTTPQLPSGEWLASFGAYSTDLPDGAETFDAELSTGFPARHQSRTVVQLAISVPVAQLGVATLASVSSYNLLLNGEVLQNGRLFDRFRYKFDFPLDEVGDQRLPMVFQRRLREGEYTLILKLEDVNGKRFYRHQGPLVVPQVELEPPPPPDPETAALLAEATAALSTLEHTVTILVPVDEVQVGRVRFDTLVTGPRVERVSFSLDGKAILTKRSPPFSVELDLGHLPRSQLLRAASADGAGEELASDELLINASAHRFSVRLVQPRPGQRYRHSLQASVNVEVPDGQTVERVELYLNETLMATLFQPPYDQPIVLPEESAIAYLRAVAYLPDGSSTEDLVFINSPAGMEELKIDLVELYTTVLDRHQRPVVGLQREAFRVLENKTPQEILRFDHVENLAFHASLLLDVSASMEASLEEAQKGALRFFEEAVTPKDRVALITFNDRPNLAVKFTNDGRRLAGGLAGLKPERGTALYDSLVFALYYFNGIKGQRALLVLSDGKDESSRFTFDETLEFARRAGVTIYTIGLALTRGDLDAKKALKRLAEETGGRTFVVDQARELTSVYEAIEEELRSQYLIAYQSSNTKSDSKFREVELKVSTPGVEAKTMRGYYP